jgi:hypothetical protein
VEPKRSRPVLCPSAQPEIAGCVAFGVVGGTVEQPRVAWLERPVPVTAGLLALSGPVHPTEVLRLAAPCQGNACCHFDGTDCRLATKLVQLLETVTEPLPPCQIRPDCRWFLQEGRVACQRCPQIVTCAMNPSEQLSLAATPD